MKAVRRFGRRGTQSANLLDKGRRTQNLSTNFGYCRYLSYKVVCVSRSQVSLISEDSFKELVQNWIDMEKLPIESAVLLSAFGHTKTRINRQM